MKKFLLIAVAVFIQPLLLLSQNLVPQWVDSVPGHLGAGKDIVISHDGFLYSAGFVSLQAPYNKRFSVFKHDKAGNRIWWFQTDTILSGDIGEANAITMSYDGFIYAVGSKEFSSGGGRDMCVYKLDSHGTEIWNRAYDGPATNDDFANDIVVDDAGNVYITGTRNNINNFREIATIKYDASGNLLWSVFDYVNNTSSSMSSFDIEVDGLGNVYVAGGEGYFISPSAKSRALLISYDRNGIQRFRKTYNPVNNYSSFAKKVKVDSNYNSYISGPDSDNNAYIIKYDSSGIEQWTYKKQGGYGDDLELSRNGFLYMSGCWWDTAHGSKCDMLLAKVDTSGNELWAVTAGGINYDWDYGLNICVDKSDDVFMNGVYMDSVLDLRMGILKYSSAGNLLAMGGFSENKCFGLNTPVAAVVDDSSNVFVTSQSCTPGSDEYYIILRYEDLSTGFEELSGIKSLNVYPNPVSGITTIYFYNQLFSNISITLFDLSGRKIKNIATERLLTKDNFHSFYFNADEIESGIYFVVISTENNNIVRKIVKH